MKLQSIAMLALWIGVGCDSSAAAAAHSDSFVDEDPPMGGCESGDTGPCAAGSADGSAAAGEPCDGTFQCGASLSCAAPFAAGDPGPLICQASCIAIGDPAFWCSDDAACCSGSCGPRGLCLPDASDDGSTSGSSDDGGQRDAGSTTATGSTTVSGSTTATGSTG